MYAFEGSEKKFELVVHQGHPSLREQSKLWLKCIECSRAQVLGHFGNAHCDAYLLSESSLFVYDRSVVMITCGQTRLVEALCLAIQTLGSDQIDLLVFERKNEFFPHLQPSRFDDDVTCIREMVPGMIAKYGHKERNHLKVFFSAKPFEPVKKDMTVEILMHNLHPQILPAFDAQGDNLERIRHQLGLWHLMEDFSIQDHLFSPRGYSLNALREHAYYTIHVTPECEGSYASFETNQHFSSNTDLKKLIEKVADTFQPADFVVILFEPVQSADFHSSWSWLPYRLVDEGIQDLDCGYRFHFYNFAKEGVQ